MASNVKWNLVFNSRHQNIIPICNNELLLCHFHLQSALLWKMLKCIYQCHSAVMHHLLLLRRKKWKLALQMASKLCFIIRLTTEVSASLGKSPTKVTVLPKQRVWIESSMNEKACYLPHVGRTTSHPLASPQFPQVFYKGKIASVNFSTCFTFFVQSTLGEKKNVNR